jgi:hypothetical protein
MTNRELSFIGIMEQKAIVLALGAYGERENQVIWIIIEKKILLGRIMRVSTWCHTEKRSENKE